MTASEIFGVPVKDMPADVRRRAKAINFGIVYGISGFGLANQLGIARGEADDYIKKYFQRFPGIRDYMEATKAARAATDGYVETLFGRRIHIREINSKNQGLRGGAERAAINAPIQGAAADIIRRAMIRMPRRRWPAKSCTRRCCCRCMTSWSSRRADKRRREASAAGRVRHGEGGAAGYLAQRAS